jgi:septum formation protein
MKSSTMPLILASASPRRIQLLKEWGLNYKVIPSHIDEATRRKRPHAIVKDLALQKARAIAEKLSEGIVIGADTIVVLKGKVIGKPRDERHAARMLAMLNGTCHRVYTGVAVIDAASKTERIAYAVSRVRMRRLADAEIVRLSAKHLDKAGAYAVQEKSDAFVERIEGDYFNVVGLPKDTLKELLKSFGIIFK